jgi:hypothetical protein
MPVSCEKNMAAIHIIITSSHSKHWANLHNRKHNVMTVQTGSNSENTSNVYRHNQKTNYISYVVNTKVTMLLRHNTNRHYKEIV